MSLILDGIFAVIGVGGAAWGFWQKQKLDAVSRVFGKKFIDKLASPKSGMIVTYIKEHLVEFDFLPSALVDENGYYEIPVKIGDGEDVYYRKVAIDDVFSVRGKVPIAFIHYAKIRAFNIHQIKTLEVATLNDALEELMYDYNTYFSLNEAIKSLNSRMTFVTDPKEVARIRQQIRQNRELMHNIQQKWGLVMAELLEGRDVILKDDERAILVRPVNFAKFAEVTTGAPPTQISKMARDMFHRYATKFTEDVLRFMRLPGLSGKSTPGLGSMTLMLGVLLVLGMAALVLLRGG